MDRDERQAGLEVRQGVWRFLTRAGRRLDNEQLIELTFDKIDGAAW
jgi:hypothetical protein